MPGLCDDTQHITGRRAGRPADLRVWSVLRRLRLVWSTTHACVTPPPGRPHAVTVTSPPARRRRVWRDASIASRTLLAYLPVRRPLDTITAV